MRTLIAVCCRDRRELVEPCLRSIVAAFGPSLELGAGCTLLVHMDPLTTEYDGAWLRGLGAAVTRLDLPADMPPKERIARMRADAALTAAGFGFDRVLFLDSDVVVSRELPAELDRLWPLVSRAGTYGYALALGNLGLYQRPGFLVEPCPALRASVRTHALGSCLAFPVNDALIEWAQNPPANSWDTHVSTVVARNRILTSDVSYVRHDGRHSGLCMRAFPGLDYQNLAADLVRE